MRGNLGTCVFGRLTRLYTMPRRALGRRRPPSQSGGTIETRNNRGRTRSSRVDVYALLTAILRLPVNGTYGHRQSPFIYITCRLIGKKICYFSFLFCCCWVPASRCHIKFTFLCGYTRVNLTAKIVRRSAGLERQSLQKATLNFKFLLGSDMRVSLVNNIPLAFALELLSAWFIFNQFFPSAVYSGYNSARRNTLVKVE